MRKQARAGHSWPMMIQLHGRFKLQQSSDMNPDLLTPSAYAAWISAKFQYRHHCHGAIRLVRVSSQGQAPAPHASPLFRTAVLLPYQPWLPTLGTLYYFPPPCPRLSSSQLGGLLASLCALGPGAPHEVLNKGGSWQGREGKGPSPINPRAKSGFSMPTAVCSIFLPTLRAKAHHEPCPWSSREPQASGSLPSSATGW